MVSLSLKHVEELALLLSAEQRRELIARLSRSAASLSESSESSPEESPDRRTPKRLYGDWKGKFPEDFDVDAALREIREQWTRRDAA